MEKKKTKKRFEEKEIKRREKRKANRGKEEILQLYNTSENESISKTTH